MLITKHGWRKTPTMHASPWNIRAVERTEWGNSIVAMVVKVLWSESMVCIFTVLSQDALKQTRWWTSKRRIENWHQSTNQWFSSSPDHLLRRRRVQELIHTIRMWFVFSNTCESFGCVIHDDTTIPMPNEQQWFDLNQGQSQVCRSAIRECVAHSDWRRNRSEGWEGCEWSMGLTGRVLHFWDVYILIKWDHCNNVLIVVVGNG